MKSITQQERSRLEILKEQLTDSEWFQVYRILFCDGRKKVDPLITDEAIHCVKADRLVGEMVCHDGPVWAL